LIIGWGFLGRWFKTVRQRNVLLIVNPLSSRARESIAPADRLRARGFCVVERELRDPGAISDTVRQESADADLIVLGGGDGTLNAAAAAIKERGLPVGILPLGTANDLARTLGIPPRLDESCDIIAEGHTSRIDLGCVNGRLFFNVASMGVSARVGQLMTKRAKRRWGVISYPLTLVKALRDMRPFRVRIVCDGVVHVLNAIQVTVGNGRHYGGGMTVDEHASIHDGRLHLFVVKPRGFWKLIRFFPDLYRGRHQNWDGVRPLVGRDIEITTYRTLNINTDGELTTVTPARFHVVSQALSVFAPRSGR